MARKKVKPLSIMTYFYLIDNKKQNKSHLSLCKFSADEKQDYFLHLVLTNLETSAL